ncbi:MAG TPA: protein translocase subunit SecD, partial [Trueperaceae bacterium]|nr:protein translocase subunit SecD [Trueperaceae bacterium]
MNRAATGILILAAVIASVLYLWQPWAPDQTSLKLGLDLQGGLRVTLQSEEENPTREDLETARNIIENRVNQFGVAESLVQTAGDRRIVVELPGLTADDQQRALDLIGQQAVLEFRLVNPDSNSIPTQQLTLADLQPTSFTGEIVANATASFGQSIGMPGGPVVQFDIRPQSATEFGTFTGSNLGRRMAIVLDDVIITAPTLEGRISNTGQITGIGSLDEASDIALVLRSGSLPINLQVAEVRSIGPTLGQDAIDAGTTAAIIGGLAVIIAVIAYYGLLFGGVLAFGVALALLFIFGVLAGLEASLTLPGLAGLVLTIGAAVDGNVISFERIREELRAGKGIRLAMKRGFQHSLSAIIDANVTTLLAAAALYQYTSGPVRGFAVTLAIGIVAAVFVNTVVVPFVLDVLTVNGGRTFLWKGFEIRGPQYVKRGSIFVPLGILLSVASIAWVLIAGLPLSTDFTGGQNVTLNVPQETTVADVRAGIDALEIEGLDAASATIVEAQGESGQPQMLIRTGLTDTELGGQGDFGALLADQVNGEVLSADFVGPSIGADLRRGAIMAVVLSLALILVYVGWRFWPTWGVAVAAIAASAHDVLISLGVLALLQIEFSIPVLAALLFVVGYSLNDSIIVADRIRENL